VQHLLAPLYASAASHSLFAEVADKTVHVHCFTAHRVEHAVNRNGLATFSAVHTLSNAPFLRAVLAQNLALVLNENEVSNHFLAISTLETILVPLSLVGGHSTLARLGGELTSHADFL